VWEILGLFEFHAPKYCHECGFAYPWTETRLHVLKEIANQTAELSLEEREELPKSIAPPILVGPILSPTTRS
jgi:hypothetical protein